MRISLRQRSGAIILFDFKAAFPSLSIDFLMASLEQMGMPTPARNLIRSLYSAQACQISLAGSTYPGFAISSGIR